MIGKILSELAGRGRRVPREGLLRLSSKNGNQNFYKGKGVKSTGVHTSIGRPFLSLSQASMGYKTLIQIQIDLIYCMTARLHQWASSVYLVHIAFSMCSERLSAGGYKALDARKPEYIIPDLSKTQVGTFWSYRIAWAGDKGLCESFLGWCAGKQSPCIISLLYV